MTEPVRGFAEAEFRARTARAQTLMENAGLSALLLTTAAEIQYYTGFLTRFWESPTRPWFVFIPANGDPVAVIPTIGVCLMAKTWITDIRSWNAPDYGDNGIGLLADALCEAVPQAGRIGMAHHIESHARVPLADLADLRGRLGGRCLTNDAAITRTLRMVKSEAEIAKISHAARIASRAFERVPQIARVGSALGEVFRAFQCLCLEEGADWVPYLAGAAGQNGYGDVISPATDEVLQASDVMMLDTGLVWDGYFCDFDRNFSVGEPSQSISDAHQTLLEATAAGFNVARPGNRMFDLYAAMAGVLGSRAGPGRLGHGLGVQLTEWPSILPTDDTVLEAGMVLTLEPCISTQTDKILVHEENIVIRET
ncbi:MAG: Xaa-Pro peptidase family protein, partial [Pseudomonadota bacterium]